MIYISHLINLVAIYAILAMSLNLLLGYSGLVSLAQAAFFGIGAYASALVLINFGVNYFVALPIAILISMLISGLISVPALRTRSDYLVLLTLGFQMIIFGLLMTQRNLTRGLMGLSHIPRPEIFGIQLTSAPEYLPLTVGAAILCFLLLRHITTSPFGRLLKAMREDEDLSLSFGKNTMGLKIRAFVVAGGIAAVGGSLFASYTTFLTPLYFKTDTSILLIAMVALGGLANLYGSIVGAFLLVVIPEALTFLASGIKIGFIEISGYELGGPLQAIVYGLLLILFMRFRPQGIIPEYSRFRPGGSDASKPESESPAKGVATVNLLNPSLATVTESSGDRAIGAMALVGRPAGPEGVAVNEVEERHASGLPSVKARAGAGEGNHEALLTTRGVSKHFGGLKAVDRLDLELKAHQITALIGSNGAGKTTSFNLITGFITPDSGQVIQRGTPITGLAPYRIARRGVVRSWQGARVFNGLSVLDNVLTARPNQKGESLLHLVLRPRSVRAEEAQNRQVALRCLTFVGLEKKAPLLAGELAFAEQKMLQIACLLATEAEVLLLDEPVSGVDPNWIRHLTRLLKELVAQGKTICVIEHNLDVVKDLADYAFFLDQGHVVAADTPSALMSDPKLVDLYFGS
jgi:ABC-type branched-subunit amino acid transport system ATPase component/ABC-type branched-subunit amino acid transport system permease subunit